MNAVSNEKPGRLVYKFAVVPRCTKVHSQITCESKVKLLFPQPRSQGSLLLDQVGEDPGNEVVVSLGS